MARLLGLLAAGESKATIIADYPFLETEDFDQALRYAAFRADEETLDLVQVDMMLGQVARRPRPIGRPPKTPDTT